VVVLGVDMVRLPLTKSARERPSLNMILQYVVVHSLLSVICSLCNGPVVTAHASIGRVLFPGELDFLYMGTVYCWVVWRDDSIVCWMG